VAEARADPEALATLLGNTHLPRWLEDLDDLLGALFLGGLAVPDPELPEALEALAERAGALGLASGRQQVAQLGARLRELVEGGPTRRVRAEAVWEALQRTLCWRRVFRTELDFLEVRARMGQGGEVLRPEASRLPTASRRVRAVGLELAGARLVLWCRDVETGEDVVLLDELAEVPVDPFQGRVISRLFQEALWLRDVLMAEIALCEHPVSMRGGRPVFAPAYTVRPTLDSAGAGEVLALPELPLRSSGAIDFRHGEGPGRIRLVASRHGERVGLRTLDGVGSGVAMGEVLRLNLIKLLVREQAASVEVEAVILRRRAGPVLLRVEADGREACFPTVDPRAIGLDRRQLADRVGETSAGRCLAAWLRREPGHIDLPGFSGIEGLEALWTRAYTGSEERAPEGLEASLAEALEGQVVDALTLWAIGHFDLVDRLRDPLLALYERAYLTVSDEPKIPEICARALLIHWLALPNTDATGFLTAHLDAIGRSARDPSQTLPEARALGWLLEAVGVVTGDAQPAERLGLPRSRVLVLVAEALWTWSHRPSEASRWALRDALWLAERVGLVSVFLEDAEI